MSEQGETKEPESPEEFGDAEKEDSVDAGDNEKQE